MHKFLTLVIAIMGATTFGCASATEEDVDVSQSKSAEQVECKDDGTSGSCEQAKPSTPTDEKITPKATEMHRWQPATD